MVEKIIKFIIVLSGLFFYKMLDAQDRFYPAQYAFFIFSAGILGSILLYQKNKWISFIFALCSFGFLKTYLMQQAPLEFLFKTSLFGVGAFFVYYFTRQLELKEETLKWFIIPACFNIALIIIQKFDHSFLSFIPVKGISGFLGNRGISALFIAMTTPLFLKYFKKGLPFLFLALLFSSILAFIISLLITVIYFYYLKKYLNKISIAGLSLIVFLILIAFRGKIIESLHYRASETVGVLDGIKHNPVLGWGLGSFEPVMMNVAQDNKLKYLGIPLSQTNLILGHPHNEILLGWWNFGILFPVLIILFLVDFFKKGRIDNIIPFLIFISGVISSCFYFLSPPAWLMLMVSLGVYENKEV